MRKAPPGEGEALKDISNADFSQAAAGIQYSPTAPLMSTATGDIVVPRAPATPTSPGADAATMVADVIFRRQVEQLYHSGPRLIAELFAELAVEYGLGPAIDETIARYLALPDDALDAAGGRHLPPLPIHEVWR